MPSYAVHNEGPGIVGCRGVKDCRDKHEWLQLTAGVPKATRDEAIFTVKLLNASRVSYVPGKVLAHQK